MTTTKTRAERFRHAEVQRRHRQRIKELGIPSPAEVGLAAIESWRREMERWQKIKATGRTPDGQIVNIGTEQAGRLKRLVQGTVDVLVSRGFNRGQSAHRLTRLVAEGDRAASAQAAGPDDEDPDNASVDRITG